jgi:hypothetical protein
MFNVGSFENDRTIRRDEAQQQPVFPPRLQQSSQRKSVSARSEANAAA